MRVKMSVDIPSFGDNMQVLSEIEKLIREINIKQRELARLMGQLGPLYLDITDKENTSSGE